MSAEGPVTLRCRLALQFGIQGTQGERARCLCSHPRQRECNGGYKIAVAVIDPFHSHRTSFAPNAGAPVLLLRRRMTRATRRWPAPSRMSSWPVSCICRHVNFAVPMTRQVLTFVAVVHLMSPVSAQTPPAPPPPPPVPPPASAPVASGPAVNVSIPVFLEKNFIGRDPLKESVLGCTPDATARLLQLREALASHTHAGLDEILYVVAGEG